MSTAGDRLLDRLAPVATYDDENGGVVAALAETLAEPQQIVDDVARDQEDGQLAWQPALDPDTAPSVLLPWLAQFPGVALPPDASEQEWRDRIKQAAGYYRGTVRAIREEVQRTLTGTKSVIVLEQVSSDPWAVTVKTRTGETPNVTATTAAALSQKPAGMLMTVVVSDEPILDEGGAARTIDGIGSAGTTIDAVATTDWT